MGTAPADEALPHPGEVPASVAALADGIRTGSAQLTAFANGIDAARGSLHAAWSGDDATAADQEVGALAAVCLALAQIDSYRQQLTDLQAQWRALVTSQEESAVACRSALDAAASADAGQQDGGLGLWTAVGAAALTFDDRARAAQVGAIVPGSTSSGSAVADAKWNLLSEAERGFYRQVAQTEYSLPAVLGRTDAIPSLWAGLPPMAQQSLIHDKPSEIGSTNGLPMIARDQANRITLPDALATTRAELDRLVADGPAPVIPGNDSSTYLQLQVNQDAWQHQVDTANAKIAALTDIQSRLTADHQPPTYLMDLDATGRGLAVIASGNPDTSAVVSTYVPGTGSELGNIGGDVRRSEDMVQSALLAGAPSAASITWVGYHSPPTIPEAAKEGYADASVDSLDGFLDGVRASHQAGEPFRSVVLSHSYGTLLVAHAASGEHSAYWAPDSSSLRNIGIVIAGGTPEVPK